MDSDPYVVSAGTEAYARAANQTDETEKEFGDAAGTGEEGKVIHFRLAFRQCIVEASAVLEVVRARITPVPGTTPLVAGIIYRQGRVVPVLETGSLLQPPEPSVLTTEQKPEQSGSGGEDGTSLVLITRLPFAAPQRNVALLNAPQGVDDNIGFIGLRIQAVLGLYPVPEDDLRIAQKEAVPGGTAYVTLPESAEGGPGQRVLLLSLPILLRGLLTILPPVAVIVGTTGTKGIMGTGRTAAPDRPAADDGVINDER